VRGAFIRFRIMAYIVGVMLLILTFAVIMRYGFGQPTLSKVVSPIHGFLYMIYLVTVIDVGLRAKFSVVKMVLVMLAGTIPFVSFYAEHRVAEEIKPQLAQSGTPA